MVENRKLIQNALKLIAVLGVFTQAMFASPPPWYLQQQMVEEICSDINTPEKKAEAVSELISIVKDNKKDVHLRRLAAEKLGELRALEAKETLKSVALRLEPNDTTRYLKQSCGLSYWKIKVSEDPNRQSQNELLMNLLWSHKHPPPYASPVPDWAADELSNRGVKQALPDIIKSINYWFNDQRAQERIWLCSRKIELLTTSRSRQEALLQALTASDPTRDQNIHRWAIRELDKLNTEESRAALIAFAVNLQDEYFDSAMKWKGEPGDRAAAYAGGFYRTIIKMLQEQGFSLAQIRDTGLQPNKYFFWVK